MVEINEDMPPGLRVGAFSTREITEWYERATPETFKLVPSQTLEQPGPLRFRKRGFRLGRRGSAHIATLQRLDVGTVSPSETIIASANMRNGAIHLLSASARPRLIGWGGHPARVAPGDVDGDGRTDLVVSDLGDMMPTDDPVGRVLVAFARGPMEFEMVVVAEGLPRVADARPVHADGDGDVDIAVAAFGMRHTGGVYLLRNTAKKGGPPRFSPERLIRRAGPVSLIPVKDLLPGTGLAFAVAFAQQHEMVSLVHAEPVAGEGEPPRHREQVLYQAPHPNWGVSNLESADLDGDGDLDFLLAHGDTMDDGFAFKPYHGVEWLENRGEAPFAHRRVGDLYGAHRAEAADLDGDGDLDVVASSYLAQVPAGGPPGAVKVDSVVWFERRGEHWIPWSLERNHPRHTGLTTIDLNGDGRVDILGAINFSWDPPPHPQGGPAIEGWINLGPRP